MSARDKVGAEASAAPPLSNPPPHVTQGSSQPRVPRTKKDKSNKEVFGFEDNSGDDGVLDTVLSADKRTRARAPERAQQTDVLTTDSEASAPTVNTASATGAGAGAEMVTGAGTGTGTGTGRGRGQKRPRSSGATFKTPLRPPGAPVLPVPVLKRTGASGTQAKGGGGNHARAPRTSKFLAFPQAVVYAPLCAPFVPFAPTPRVLQRVDEYAIVMAKVTCCIPCIAGCACIHG